MKENYRHKSSSSESISSYDSRSVSSRSRSSESGTSSYQRARRHHGVVTHRKRRYSHDRSNSKVSYRRRTRHTPYRKIERRRVSSQSSQSSDTRRSSDSPSPSRRRQHYRNPVHPPSGDVKRRSRGYQPKPHVASTMMTDHQRIPHHSTLRHHGYRQGHYESSPHQLSLARQSSPLRSRRLMSRRGAEPFPVKHIPHRRLPSSRYGIVRPSISPYRHARVPPEKYQVTHEGAMRYRRPFRRHVPIQKYTVDRSCTCPFLLRVFHRSLHHYSLETFNQYLLNKPPLLTSHQEEPSSSEKKDIKDPSEHQSETEDVSVNPQVSDDVIVMADDPSKPSSIKEDELTKATTTYLSDSPNTMKDQSPQLTPKDKKMDAINEEDDDDQKLEEEPVTLDAFFDSELQLYVWKDSTLREIVDLVNDLYPQTRLQNARISLRLLQTTDKGLFQFFELGTLHSSRPHPDDRRTLHSSPLEIGDMLSIAIITTPRYQSARRPYQTPTMDLDKFVTPQSSAFDPMSSEQIETSTTQIF